MAVAAAASDIVVAVGVAVVAAAEGRPSLVAVVGVVDMQLVVLVADAEGSQLVAAVQEHRKVVAVGAAAVVGSYQQAVAVVGLEEGLGHRTVQQQGQHQCQDRAAVPAVFAFGKMDQIEPSFVVAVEVEHSVAAHRTGGLAAEVVAG